jgi:NCAIR mutase (PurE)-related protein
MDESALRALLDDVATGRVTAEDAAARLRRLPYADLGYARVDHHRTLRQGLPEAVYGPGKTAEQCADIVGELLSEPSGGPVVLTRATTEQVEAVLAAHPGAAVTGPAQTGSMQAGPAETSPSQTVATSTASTPTGPGQGGSTPAGLPPTSPRQTGAAPTAPTPAGPTQTSAEASAPNPAGLTLVWRPSPPRPERVVVVTAGTADLPVADECAATLAAFGFKPSLLADCGVAGVHRLLDVAEEVLDADAVVVVAGMEGALASLVGGITGAPVVAVPTSVGYGASLQGVTALLAMLASCAAGLVVVGIDNGFGAACAVARILPAARE